MATNEINNLIYAALDFVSKDKYKEAQNIIESILNKESSLRELNNFDWEYIAGAFLVMGKLELARTAYIKANNLPGAAFTLIMLGRVEEANNILSSARVSPASSWCNFLAKFFLGDIADREWPSFLLIRHFLEFTVYHLLLTKNYAYVELLLKNLDRLLDINLDSEKFIGYAYFHFGEVDQAICFLNSAIKRNPLDGEIYFVLAQAYLAKNSPFEALCMLESAKLLLPYHFPTCELLEKVRADVKSK